MDQLTLAKIMMKLNDLPFLPTIAIRVIELTDAPKSTTAEICQVIGQDQVLVSKLLKLVNSAYYGLPRRVATITEAVTLLGMETLRTVVIGASVHNTVKQMKTARGIRQEPFWRHSAACATASRILAIKLGIAQKEHAFVAGLLHDIGKIILASLLPEQYLNVIRAFNVNKKCLIESEMEHLNFTHTDIGKIAAEKWNLPYILVEPIGYHHNPRTEVEYPELVTVVHLADAVSKMAGYGTVKQDTISIDPQILDNCHLTYNELCLISDEIKGKISIEFL